MTKPSAFDAALLDDARSFVSSKFGGNDMSGVPLDAVRHAIESLYDGGWHAYVADFRRFTATSQPAQREVWSPVKQRAVVGALTRRALRDYDEVLTFDYDPTTHATFVVSRPSVIDRRSRRDIITERELTLYKFTRDGLNWEWDSVTITEAVHEEHSRYGTINTLPRDRDKRDQYELCYRPGTEKSPMQGWAARLELSWEQAHANEVFQSPTKEKK